MARPRIEINWEEFDKLCAMGSTKQEIADWFGCSPDTLERAVTRDFKVGFAEHYGHKAVRTNISLRRAQMKYALEGNASLLIWLGKQYLGQSDKKDPEALASGVTAKPPVIATPEDIAKAIRLARGEAVGTKE